MHILGTWKFKLNMYTCMCTCIHVCILWVCFTINFYLHQYQQPTWGEWKSRGWWNKWSWSRSGVSAIRPQIVDILNFVHDQILQCEHKPRCSSWNNTNYSLIWCLLQVCTDSFFLLFIVHVHVYPISFLVHILMFVGNTLTSFDLTGEPDASADSDSELDDLPLPPIAVT